MADFRHHVTAHLLQTVFALHDEERFEVVCYAFRV
jgi:predicted O-linked N-acetylglucosamine transferase (SPINDLY family)